MSWNHLAGALATDVVPAWALFILIVSVLLLTRPVSAVITLNGLSPFTTFASTAGGTVLIFTPIGSFTGLTATLDGVPVPIQTYTSGPLRILRTLPVKWRLTSAGLPVADPASFLEGNDLSESPLKM